LSDPEHLPVEGRHRQRRPLQRQALHDLLHLGRQGPSFVPVGPCLPDQAGQAELPIEGDPALRRSVRDAGFTGGLDQGPPFFQMGLEQAKSLQGLLALRLGKRGEFIHCWRVPGNDTPLTAKDYTPNSAEIDRARRRYSSS
jgi:hypothetical protein